MMSLPVNDGLLQVFDVEHGACALLTTPRPGGGVMRLLVDCGHNATKKWYPGEHLRRLGATVVEQFVVTNYDEDHLSGYRNLLEQGVEVEWLYRNVSVAPQTIRWLKSETGMGPGIEALVTSLNRFDPPGHNAANQPVFPGVAFEAFYNSYPDFDDENNLSLVLHLEVHGHSFLFPGDMERAGFEHLLATNARFRQVVGQITVLMASHHGRKSGICPDMFDVWGCRPTLVVISDDYKQYDTQETTAYYASKAKGITNFRSAGVNRRVLTTRTDGEVCFSFQGANCWVS